MKQVKFITGLMAFGVVSLFAGCGEKENEMTKVTLNEVAHSIFYAPQYVALENGYFTQEGLDLDLVTGYGADKTMAAVISGEAQIGFMGAEASVYAYLEGANDPVINFAQGTQRAGNFLVAREEMADFQWSDLKGKKVLGGRKGGMPEMVFEYILKENGLDPAKDLSIDQSIDFGSTAAAFSGGKGEFTVEFEPAATTLEKNGDGFVVASLGVDSGYVPYTSYSAKTSYVEKHPEIIQAFTDGLQKGVDYVNSHTAEEIAKVIQPQFKENDLDTNIFRQTHLSGQGRNENDAEHAWHMAIMAYLLREYSNEPVDIGLVMLMCLIHDIVEIDAGDTYAYDADGLKTQKAREDAAKERIFSLLPEDQKQELVRIFDEFEAFQTPEAKFARAMDNLQPLLLNDSNDGGDWKEHEVNAEKVYGRQRKTKRGSEKLFEVTDQILKENIAKGNLPE